MQSDPNSTESRRSRRPRREGGPRAVERFEPRLLRAAHVAGSATSYATIQAAVNAAPVGGTVTVGAGAYAEQVTVGKPLTIRGPQAGVDARGAARTAGTATTEAIVSGAASGTTHSAAFHILADDVTVDGFTIAGETSRDDDLGAGIVIGPGVSGTHVLNDVVVNNVAGLFLANASATDLALIQHCYFATNNNDGDNGGRGIYTNGEISGGNLTNVTIDANTFYKNLGGNGTTGLEAACAFEAGQAGEQSDIRITNNAFTGNGKAVLFFNTTGGLIQGNTVTQCQDQYSGSLRFEGNNADFTIRFNTVYNNTGPGVAIDSKGVPGDNGGFLVNDNNFYDNNAGYAVPISAVANFDSYDGAFDARYNFWGATSGPSGYGPGTGDAVGSGEMNTGGVGWSLDADHTEDVLYAPWATGAITAPTGTNDYLRLAADGTTLDVWYGTAPTGTPDLAEPLSRLSVLAIDPIAAGPSTVTIDFSNGNPLPAGGLSVDGAYGLASVGLVIVGTTGGDAVAVNATTVTVGSNPAITYAGLTGISVNGNGGADTITQSAQPGGKATLALIGATATDALAVTGGTFTVAAPAAGSGVTTYALSALTVASGDGFVVATAAAVADRRVLRIGALSDGGRLDLGGNDMILPGADLPTITALARAGYAGGTWAGTGLTSSAAAADARHVTGLGVIRNVGVDGATRLYGTFDGQPVAGTDVLVKDTLYGDANLSGAVDIADYTALDAGYIRGGTSTGWAGGNANYDGVVDGSDYALVDNAFNLQPPAASTASAAVTAATRATVTTDLLVTHPAAPIPPLSLGTPDDQRKLRLSRIVIDSLQ